MIDLENYLNFERPGLFTWAHNSASDFRTYAVMHPKRGGKQRKRIENTEVYTSYAPF